MSNELTNGTNGTPEKKWRDVFLNKLAEHGSVKLAAKQARVGRTTVYRERAEDDVFATEWDLAKNIGIDALEDESIERAFNGSDILLMFRLKAERPKYRDKQPAGLSITVEQLQEMSDQELDDLAAKLARFS